MVKDKTAAQKPIKTADIKNLCLLKIPFTKVPSPGVTSLRGCAGSGEGCEERRWHIFVLRRHAESLSFHLSLPSWTRHDQLNFRRSRLRVTSHFQFKAGCEICQYVTT